MSTMKEDNASSRSNIRKPNLKRNIHSGNSVSFAREQEERDEGLPKPIASPPVSYSNMRSQSFTSSKTKLKPLLKQKSLEASNESRSMAEIDTMDIFPPRSTLHTRSSSGVSIVTTGSLNHRQYRQGQSYTPPMARSRSRADSADDLTFYGPMPKSSRTPPPLHVRTHSTSSNPRIKSPSQTHLDHPQSASSFRDQPFSPESMGRSGRSSFDSVFRRRTRSNMEEDPIAAAAIVREEWFARQAAKQRKRDEEEARLKEKEERRQDRLSENARRKEHHVDQKRSRTNTINTMASSEKGSTISAIRYSNTRPGLPVDKELEWIRAGKRPPPTTRQNTSNSTMKKKARGTKNAFQKFFYDLYTVWLKLLNATGIKKAS